MPKQLFPLPFVRTRTAEKTSLAYREEVKFSEMIQASRIFIFFLQQQNIIYQKQSI